MLDKIKSTGRIFFAISSQKWVLKCANVHVSMVGFDGSDKGHAILDGLPVAEINSDLSAATDTTRCFKLTQNKGVGFQGIVKRGDFDLGAKAAEIALRAGGNPNGLPNSDVIVPSVNADELLSGRWSWTVKFDGTSSAEDVTEYEIPHKAIFDNVYKMRMKANQPEAREKWYLHWRPRTEMAATIARSERFLVTPALSKYRIFRWLSPPFLPDHALIVFNRSDDYFFLEWQSSLDQGIFKLLEIRRRVATEPPALRPHRLPPLQPGA